MCQTPVCAQNLHLTAYSPLGTPDSAEMMKRKDDRKILEDSSVVELAKELGKTPAQVVLAMYLLRGGREDGAVPGLGMS